MNLPTPIPIDALFDETNTGPNLLADPRRLLRDADIIMGVDVMSSREFLVYGAKALRRAARSVRANNLAVLKIALDQDTEELERLIALVNTIKGRNDYAAGQASRRH